MKIITREYKVYKFNELSDKAKENSREWYRIGTQNDSYWSEFVIDDCTTIASLMGIQIEHIYFRGFWSQGDGACFVGNFSSKDVKTGKVMEYAPKDKELNGIAQEFERLSKLYPNISFSVKHVGTYHHENSVDFTFDIEGNEPENYNEMVKQLEEVSKDFMRWIYKQLEQAYDDQNSDENVDYIIMSNEYEFTEDGKRFV